MSANVHGAQRMNSNDIGGSLTFPLAPPAGQRFNIFCAISTVGIGTKCCSNASTFSVLSEILTNIDIWYIYMTPFRVNSRNFGELLCLAPSSGKLFKSSKTLLY